MVKVQLCGSFRLDCKISVNKIYVVFIMSPIASSVLSTDDCTYVHFYFVTSLVTFYCYQEYSHRLVWSS